MAFCDYCECELCQKGDAWLYHAKCQDGKFICDVCYWYDVCCLDSDRCRKGPCNDADCKHRPKIISKWTTKKEDEKGKNG